MDLRPIAIALSIAAGIAPTIVYVLLIYWIDRYEKEPLSLLVATFVWGALPAVVMAIILEDVFGAPLAILSMESAEFLSASILAPLVEEIVKALALLGLVAVFRSEFNDVLDGIVYGAVIGLGFGMTENILYFISSFQDGGWAQWLVTVGVRSLVFGLMHAFYTGLVGAGLGYARVAKEKHLKRWAPWVALGAAMFFHGFHNGVLGLTLGTPLASLAIAAFSDWAGILLLGIMVILAWRKERTWIKEELGEEVALGILSPAEFRALSVPSPRATTFWRLWRAQGWQQAIRWRRLSQSAVELAFKKHQLGQASGESSLDVIARLRKRIRTQRAALGMVPRRRSFCTACGTLARPGHRFCTRCGHRFARDLSEEGL